MNESTKAVLYKRLNTHSGPLWSYFAQNETRVLFRAEPNFTIDALVLITACHPVQLTFH